MNKYQEWIEANKNNPNRAHIADWIDDETWVIIGYDKITGDGVRAVFKLSETSETNMKV